MPTGCHGHSGQFLAGFLPASVIKLHTNCFFKYRKEKLIQFLIYYSLKDLANRVGNVSYCMDDDITACCKEIYLSISGLSGFNSSFYWEQFYFL